MAVSADRVIVELEARIGKYRRDMEAAERAGTKSFGKIGKDAKAAERQILQSSTAISGSLRGLAGSFAAAFSAREVAGLIDGYTRFTNQLKVAGLEGQQLLAVQKQLLEVGNQYGVSIEELSRLYGGLSSLQKDLNTTSADTLNLTQAVAASIKISGVSSARAAGAILGLNQAFAQIRVQSDEYNQILDGARPLLQAAVNASDKYRGSLARLKQDIEAGNVSGADLFRTIQGGTSVLFPQAEKATLTLSGAFTALTNALTIYVGEASASNGTTAALSAGITKLSENLDTLATALGVISAVLIGRYASAGIAAAASNLRIAATAATAAGATSGLGVAATVTGRALLAAFGGPVGLAITAITVALGVAVAKSLELSEAEKSLAAATQTASNVTKPYADAVDKLASAQGKARIEALNYAKAQRDVAIQSREAARGVALLAKAEALRLREEARKASAADRNRDFQTGGRFALGPGFGGNNQASKASREANASFRAAADTFNAINAEVLRLDAAIAASVPAVGGGSAGGSVKKDKGASGPSAEQIANEELRNEQEFLDALRRLRAEQLQNELGVTTDGEKRLAIQGELAELERESRIASINADKSLTEARRKRLLEETNKAFGLEADGKTINTAFNTLAQARARELEDRNLELAQISLRDKIDTLQTDADLATNRVERLAIQRRILELEQQEERDNLELAIKRGEIIDAEDARLRLKQRQGNASERVERDNESPLQRFRREVGEVGNNINDEFEKVQVDGLNALNDGLVDAITGAKSLGDVFSDVANSIIKDLLRIAVQQAIIGPLADAGGGGGIFGAVLGAVAGAFGKRSAPVAGANGVSGLNLGAFGVSKRVGDFNTTISNAAPRRASGGNVIAGKLYEINENGTELFQPSQSGKIYPTGSLKARGGGGGTVVIAPQQFDLSGVVMTEDLVAQIDARNRAYTDQVGRTAIAQAIRGSGPYNDQQRKLRG